jgi:hypothetical protein
MIGVGLSLAQRRVVAAGGGPAPLIVNGGFSDGTTGWTSQQAPGSGIGSAFTAPGGIGTLAVANGGSVAQASQAFTTVIGASYKVSGQLLSGNGEAYIYKSDNPTAGTNPAFFQNNVGSFTDAVFVATATTSHIVLQCNAAGATFDNISAAPA